MARLHQLRFSVLLYALLVFCAGELRADETPATRISAKRLQRQVARLLKDYRHVKTVELKQGYVDEATKRGGPFTDGLKRQIEADGQAWLRVYRELFLATIDDAPRIEPLSIVDANDKLQKQRTYLLQLHAWADKLAAPKKAPAAQEQGEELEQSASEQLREREQSYVKQWLRAKGMGSITGVEASLIREVNRFRAEEKLPPLQVDYKLCAAARDHSLDMTRERFFSHKSELRHKLTYAHRAVRFGTTARSEIIANCTTPNMVVPMWKASPGHERAMRDPRVHRVGVGHIGRKYTMMFGMGPVKKEEQNPSAE